MMALILSLTAFIFTIVYSGEPLIDLVDQHKPTKAAFYDFDRTLSVESFGGKVRDKCLEENIDTAPGCSGEGDMVRALGLFDMSRIEEAFGGDKRIMRLEENLARMLKSTSSIVEDAIFVLSTSYEPIPAVEWEDMIFEMMVMIGLDNYFPRDHILGLDDPGPGIQADKGSKAKEQLDRLGIKNMHECIFADDKQGNLNWAYCQDIDGEGNPCDAEPNNVGNRAICNTILIQERAGMDGTDFNYFEARTCIIPKKKKKKRNKNKKLRKF